MGSARSFALLAIAVFAGALIGAMIGSGTAAQATDEPALAAVADVPKGAVVAFDKATCPAGWSAFKQARGRTIVGLNPEGTLRAKVGAKLDDMEARQHKHKVDPEAQLVGVVEDHSHTWATYREGQFSPGGDGIEFVPWNNGIDAVGEGIYPMAVDFRGAIGSTWFIDTDTAGAHSHPVDIEEATSSATGNRFPFVQLLMCEKD